MTKQSTTFSVLLESHGVMQRVVDRSLRNRRKEVTGRTFGSPCSFTAAEGMVK
jgi:hypothetical protein